MAYKSTPTFSYDATLVWAAACAAQRINGEYFKGTKWPDAPVGSKISNRDLIENILRNDASTHTYISGMRLLMKSGSFQLRRLTVRLLSMMNRFCSLVVDLRLVIDWFCIYLNLIVFL